MVVIEQNFIPNRKKDMATIRERVDERLIQLEQDLKKGLHLSNPEAVEERIASISKFSSTLTDGDRDFVAAARLALDEKQNGNDFIRRLNVTPAFVVLTP